MQIDRSMLVRSTVALGGRFSMSSYRKSELSAARRRLVELMKDIDFGRIQVLRLRDGDPVLDPMPRIIREIKLGSIESGAQTKLQNDFVLKSQLVELFARFDAMPDGVVELIQVKGGLPLLMHVAEPA